MKKVRVSQESLVYYKGKKYSVPPRYINQLVSIKMTDNILYIYNEGELIATHSLSNKPINYAKDHYLEGLEISLRYKEKGDIEEFATNNLRRLDGLLEMKDK
jgi:hypothetical protein